MNAARRLSGLVLCGCLAACATSSGLKLRPAANLSSIVVRGDADYYKIGRKQLYDGHVALALEAFRMDWMRHGDSIATLNGIAICYDLLGRHEIATSYFDRAAQLDPASKITQSNVAFSATQFAARTQAVPAVAENMPRPPAVPLAQVERISETEWQLSVPKPAVARKTLGVVTAAIPALHSAATLAAVPSIRIVNGTGRTHMARRFATHLRSQGVPVKRLANAAKYDRKVTVIAYAPGSEQIAEQIAAGLPVKVELREAKRKTASIEITLGTDLLEFDRSIEV